MLHNYKYLELCVCTRFRFKREQMRTHLRGRKKRAHFYFMHFFLKDWRSDLSSRVG